MLKENNTKMELRNYNVYFFFGVLILISIVTFFIFKPFLVAIVLAAILAILFQRVYAFFLSIFKNHNSLSSLLASLSVLLLIVIPLIIVFILVGNEIISSYQSIAGSGDFYQKKVVPIIEKIHTSPFYDILNLDQVLGKEAFAKYSGQIGQFALVFLQNAYSSVAHVVFMIFVMFFTLYYFFIDGKDLVRKIMYISPIKNSHENLLVDKFVSISRATIKGTFVVCLLQGTLGGIAFYIAGIEGAVIWGVVMAIFALIPMFGSSLIWLPASIILLMGGHVWQGIFVFVVGTAIISILDNILRPELVGKDTQMHPLLVFFATLGGLALFGFSGFIIGPIVVALFVSMWEIYGVEFKSQLKKYNK